MEQKPGAEWTLEVQCCFELEREEIGKNDRARGVNRDTSLFILETSGRAKEVNRN